MDNQQALTEIQVEQEKMAQLQVIEAITSKMTQ